MMDLFSCVYVTPAFCESIHSDYATKDEDERLNVSVTSVKALSHRIRRRTAPHRTARYGTVRPARGAECGEKER